jgi:hypothetical protein
VDVALGKIDSLDINWGEPTLQLWYGLLNCGFHLPASAGTDCFLNRIQSRLPGSDRAYVKIDTAFSYGEWIRNLKAGRSFVTSGPLLEFSIDGNSSERTRYLDLELFRRGLPVWRSPGPCGLITRAAVATDSSPPIAVRNIGTDGQD